MSARTPVEKLRSMVDNERPRASAVEFLDEMGADDLRSLASAIEELADAIDNARDAVETWSEAERDERADARDDALEALEAVCNAAEYEVGEVDMPAWLRGLLLTPSFDELAAEATS